MTWSMANIFFNIKNSFLRAWRGEENIAYVIWYWGVASLPIAYLLTKLIIFNKIIAIDILISLLVIIYYIWHIIVLQRCSPKIPKLTKEEKERFKEEHKGELFKHFTKKLLLQEPITKWNSTSFFTVLDLYIITVYSGYILT
jgi:hypothetical protein